MREGTNSGTSSRLNPEETPLKHPDAPHGRRPDESWPGLPLLGFGPISPNAWRHPHGLPVHPDDQLVVKSCPWGTHTGGTKERTESDPEIRLSGSRNRYRIAFPIAALPLLVGEDKPFRIQRTGTPNQFCLSGLPGDEERRS